jgi:hypothetical protein
MAKMTPYEYLVYKDEKRDKQTDAVVDAATVLVDRKVVLAKDEATAAMIAAREIPEAEMDNIDRIQVVVRPF